MDVSHSTTDMYWQNRLKDCKRALEGNNFAVFLANSTAEAKEITIGRIVPEVAPELVSYGDSMTLHATGILDALRGRRGVRVLETFDATVPRDVVIERRRQALLADLFLSGANAVTETGSLVNLDMVGNRVAAVTFGPRHVIIVVGRNKIVPDLQGAMVRIKNFAAPVNALKHPTFKTPCRKTSRCIDCRSPDRICNTWTITEKAFPRGRIKIILINQELGL